MKLILKAVCAAIGLASTAYSQTVQTCPTTDVCYSLNVPSNTASAGSGDIFFQLSAPTSYEWVALGQGTGMSGANIFVLYTDSTGKNVTLSPRLGTGQELPQHDTSAQVTLLAGSGVSNNMMIANVKCSNCNGWSGGSMDFTSSSTSWIYAFKQGSSLDSDDTNYAISQHESSDASAFTWDISNAKGGSDVNPFSSSVASSVGSAASGSAAASCTPTAASQTSASQTIAAPSGSGCPTAWPSSWSSGAWPTARPTQYASCFASGSDSSWPTSAPWQNNYKRDDSCPDGTASSGSGSSSSSSSSGVSLSDNSFGFGRNAAQANAILAAHGVMAALAFVVLFPTGGILVRVASFPGLVWVHAAMQLLGYLFYIIAFGLGIYMAMHLEMLNNSHPVIGFVLFVLLFFQPILGIFHHKYFKQYSRRTVWSYGHLWLGRFIITLGIINGGLGIRLARLLGNNNKSAEIAYGVVAAIFWLAYVASILYGELKRKRDPPANAGEGKGHRMDNLAPSDDEGVDERVPQHQEYYAKRNRAPPAYEGA